MTSGLLVVDVQNAVVEGMLGREVLVATIARLLLSLAGPHEVPERLLPDAATEHIYYGRAKQ